MFALSLDDRQVCTLLRQLLPCLRHWRPCQDRMTLGFERKLTMAKKKKIRVDLRKNRSKPPRQRQWTRGFHEHGFDEEATAQGERVRAKGELSRRRTIIQAETGAEISGQEPADMPAIDVAACQPGRVLRVQGLQSVVEAED